MDKDAHGRRGPLHHIMLAWLVWALGALANFFCIGTLGKLQSEASHILCNIPPSHVIKPISIYPMSIHVILGPPVLVSSVVMSPILPSPQVSYMRKLSNFGCIPHLVTIKWLVSWVINDFWGILSIYCIFLLFKPCMFKACCCVISIISFFYYNIWCSSSVHFTRYVSIKL